MILFNFKKVLRHSNKSTKRFLRIMRYITYRETPRDLRDLNVPISIEDWSGSNFLINPEALFTNRLKYRELELVHYIGLASMRNYSEYQAIGKTTLDLLACPGKEELINNNRLLRIENGQVIFKYEEALKQGDSKWH